MGKSLDTNVLTPPPSLRSTHGGTENISVSQSVSYFTVPLRARSPLRRLAVRLRGSAAPGLTQVERTFITEKLPYQLVGPPEVRWGNFKEASYTSTEYSLPGATGLLNHRK